MKRNEIIEKLNEIACDGQEITTRVLNANGITSENITRLVSDGVLGRVRRGVYSYSTLSKKSEVAGESERVLDGMSENERLGSSEDNVAIKKESLKSLTGEFMLALDNSKFEEACKCLDVMSKLEDGESDANFYLMLLNVLGALPGKFGIKAEEIKLENILLPERSEEHEDIISQNKLRKYAYNGCYSSALKCISSKSETEQVEKYLLLRILKQKRTYQLELVKEKKYEELKNYLLTLKAKSNLDVLEICLLSLVYILCSGNVPEKNGKSSSNVFAAVRNSDYEGALQLARQYVLKGISGTDINKNILCIILEDVVKLKYTNENKTRYYEQFPASDVAASKSAVTYFDVIKALMSDSKEKALRLLTSYLETIGASNYYGYLECLIDLSLMENDESFSKPIVALTHLSLGKSTIRESWYECKFFECMANGRQDLAKVYLDILHQLNDLDKTIPILPELSKVLGYTENTKGNVPVASSRKSKIANEEPLEVFSLSKSEKKSSQVGEDNLESRARSIVEARLDEVERVGISILKPIGPFMNDLVCKVVNSIQEVSAFIIGSDFEERVVLKSSKKEYIEVSDVLREGTEAYNSGNFGLCIKNYRKVLAYYNRPKAFVFARLGMAFRFTNKKAAINYLTIATELSKNDKRLFDFYDLIEYLRTGKETEERKPSFAMTEEEFERETDNYYDIRIDEVVDLIRSGMNPEEACETMRLDEEKTAMAMLFIARDMYIQGNEVAGDEYMKKVERMKNKTIFIKSLFDEIRC